ncbi:molybdopterin converting factor subunit 1 [Thalassotalea sp. HSM 43]|uniref:molybdopterin converting factor subunit 1 n=1 Tax=Thalassotalea sp. HSM 43 TaxID=2552945 RepID=UPI001E4EEC0D|nr:molybdopterin converting factor subunit 1 [Thalassotalea sp. HSM 43]
MMIIDVLFFAAVRESLDCPQLQLELGDEQQTLQQIKQQLAQRGEAWQKVFNDRNLMQAVNQVMVNDDSLVINSGDTLAFFPPVTGG